MIELTDEQAKAMEGQRSPLRLVHPQTGEVFVLIKSDIYQLTCGLLGGKGRAWEDDDEDLIRWPQ